jgi:hypothetical protein
MFEAIIHHAHCKMHMHYAHVLFSNLLYLVLYLHMVQYVSTGSTRVLDTRVQVLVLLLL